MATHGQFIIPDRHADGQSRVAIRFFLSSSAVLTAGIAIMVGLALVFGRPVGVRDAWFPPAFAVSSLLLALGSGTLERAIGFVRREQQAGFRRWLLISLGVGTAFIGIQGFGLWTLLPAHRAASDASLGVTPFVLMLAGLHAVHLTVAVLFLAFVATRAFADRYDHEYHWGVRFCGYFWHALGVAWLFILAIFAIAI